MIKFLRYIIAILGIGVLSLLFTNWGFYNNTTKDEIISFINDEDNGLKKQVEVEGVIYTVTYKPYDLIMARSVGANSNIDSLKGNYEHAFYFNLDISFDSLDVFGHMNGDFRRMLKTVSFELQDYIFLTNNDGKEFYLKDFIFPRCYGSTNKTSLLLCFQEDNLNDHNDLTICCTDFINGSLEKLKFNFKGSDIVKIPKLKYE